MTDFQRWAMAAIIQAYQKEIQPPDGSIRGVRRQVFLEAKNKLVASFWVHEISFNGVYLEEERNKAKFTNYPYHAGDYKFRTEGDQTGEGDYSWVRIHNRNLDETYIQGQTERGYYFTARAESYDKISIDDSQTGRTHVYRITK